MLGFPLGSNGWKEEEEQQQQQQQQQTTAGVAIDSDTRWVLACPPRLLHGHCPVDPWIGAIRRLHGDMVELRRPHPVTTTKNQVSGQMFAQWGERCHRRRYG
ncbi:hypothetical protein PG993_000048 [Apiospora rasikravindrae]|uniref:Uncharacterized protein n=1 Tax=Apiospora rasikravindrae TaxID=990691 RepID=A0ABR1U7D5_9PEZI